MPHRDPRHEAFGPLWLSSAARPQWDRWNKRLPLRHDPDKGGRSSHDGDRSPVGSARRHSMNVVSKKLEPLPSAFLRVKLRSEERSTCDGGSKKLAIEGRRGD